MASNLTFAPIAILDSGSVDFNQTALTLSRALADKGLASMLISREQFDDLERVGRISETVLKRGILPVVKFYTTDRTTQFRNLHESTALGYVDLVWEEGEPVFEIADLLEFLMKTWNARIPLDFNLYFRGELPTHISVSNIARMIGSVMARNQHVQVVKLCEIPANPEPEHSSHCRDLWNLMLESCPGSEPALSPELWVEYPVLREGIYDLGLITFEFADPCDGVCLSEEMKNAEEIAGESGLPLVARLPLTISFYKMSWFAIDVGKVLSKWAKLKAFKPYMERPRPQA